MIPSWMTPCPEALDHGRPDIHGSCPYCGRKIAPKVRQPRSDNEAPSKLTDGEAAYSYFYDPDFGSHREDVY